MLDRTYQLAYRAAYRVMRAYWGVRHPATHGSLVAIWWNGMVLLVRNSYHDYYSLPGGYLRGGETGPEAAVREVGAEIGLAIREANLVLALELAHTWEGKRDHVLIYKLELPYEPSLRVDNREVIEARFWEPREALSLELFPPLRRHIEESIAARDR